MPLPVGRIGMGEIADELGLPRSKVSLAAASVRAKRGAPPHRMSYFWTYTYTPDPLNAPTISSGYVDESTYRSHLTLSPGYRTPSGATYHWERATAAGGPWSSRGSTTATTFSEAVNVPSGPSYTLWYRVRASYPGVGTSDWSASHAMLVQRTL